MTRVAKVHRRMPAAEPLPPTRWRYYLRHLAHYVVVCLVAYWLFFIIILAV